MCLDIGHGIGASSVDVTILELQDCDVMLEDCQLQMRRVTKRLIPIASWRGGESVSIREPWRDWPNTDEVYVSHQRKELYLLVVK